MDQQKSRLEKLREKQDKLRNRIRQEQSKINKLERKERTRQLIQVGGLLEIAGLLEIDKGVLLGSLMDLAATLNNNKNEYKKTEWKQVGDRILAEREAERKARRKAELEANSTENEEIEADELLDDIEEAAATTEIGYERRY